MFSGIYGTKNAVLTSNRFEVLYSIHSFFCQICVQLLFCVTIISRVWSGSFRKLT